ncbi:hypothetical protein M3Y98_01198400 [Aphelenchoides besseyi]|nr:hypothetical protein M3Y98_01198400 [Aphelenchoides besseyi]KAI6193139.1 hypothetical protein M3Y96_00986600 [Aphelenchoides besseyi]
MKTRSQGKDMKKQFEQENTNQNNTYLLEVLNLLIRTHHTLSCSHIYAFFISTNSRSFVDVALGKLKAATDGLELLVKAQVRKTRKHKNLSPKTEIDAKVALVNGCRKKLLYVNRVLNGDWNNFIVKTLIYPEHITLCFIQNSYHCACSVVYSQVIRFLKTRIATNDH